MEDLHKAVYPETVEGS